MLTAVALVAIKTPEPKVELSKEKPPIEIEFVSLPAQNAIAEVEAKEQAAKQEPEPQPKAQSQPTEKTKPEQEPVPKAKPVSKAKVDTPSKPIEPVVRDEKPDTSPIVKVEEKKPDIIKKETPKKEAPEEKLQQPLPEPIIDTSTANEQRKIVAAQAEKAAQEAHANAVAEVKRIADAKAARDAQAAAANNTPVNFTASNANWASAPNFSFPERASRRALSGDTFNVVLILRVNKQGGIDSVRVAKSSGNSIVDKEAQRQVRSGKFKPFTKNGEPVVGNVTLPISYAVP
ncbi:TonB family protein [Psychrobacter sp. S1-30-MNA-CIBAN-0213]|uniref:energy transducer TonB n=1 Tax=unclassified Psychrobacter TaxID=196806 RepID=UPI00331BCDB1